MDYYSKTILITGASSGIGESYAEKFASLGANLILVARSEDSLKKLAAKLSEKHKVQTDVVVLDLSTANAAAELFQKHPEIYGLVNNAGFGTHGALQDQDAAKVNQEIQLNCGTLVDLTQTYLPGLLQRNEGFILNVASIAAFQPSPYMAVYSATKAFVLSFTQALWGELQGTGVTALAICPGATKTNFFVEAGSESAAVGRMRTADQVVNTTMKALEKGKHTAIDGAANKLLSFFGRVAPRNLVIPMVGRMMKN
ncbi:hypothetical protein FHU41_000091 [Psychromicrobium silvestre]|uniref:Ketoreductase domain-containing protein n=1 Tax=Psychromicrobium silvestre TaxID=1645614 RepID=A0A7Y9LQS3_9MICC|nr:SDR family oxidoreductase [Psychromicrobium silvestre]NYE93870.1 hypothetical protein [Psychromicrobium silvestre]